MWSQSRRTVASLVACVAVSLSASATQKAPAAPTEKPAAGVVVNDVHSRLNETRVNRDPASSQRAATFRPRGGAS